MSLAAPFDALAGMLQEHVVLPLLYQLGLMQWEEWSFGWALFAVYGAAQVAIIYMICVPLERWRPQTPLLVRTTTNMKTHDTHKRNLIKPLQVCFVCFNHHPDSLAA